MPGQRVKDSRIETNKTQNGLYKAISYSFRMHVLIFPIQQLFKSKPYLRYCIFFWKILTLVLARTLKVGKCLLICVVCSYRPLLS